MKFLSLVSSFEYYSNTRVCINLNLNQRMKQNILLNYPHSAPQKLDFSVRDVRAIFLYSVRQNRTCIFSKLALEFCYLISRKKTHTNTPVESNFIPKSSSKPPSSRLLSMEKCCVQIKEISSVKLPQARPS